ncbi:head maturation protease, ClpP-related [Lichenifustis flavocetrariae]|uniref:Clp protease ClpP n=1 Tax=Lichenifustis flavocetrariae TaxID=2949735 RepID=A0AA42CL33_9HYPH|nr:head maturation protease, ClpP-related [Lichenifustis flavocetrariae]MCW6506977.1 Clp protease ClpP [Lichenifustis flavocetrariae]
MPVTTISGELYLDGDVGDCGFADFFTAKEVAQALAGLGTRAPAKVRLNSGGGIATEGPAIAAAFRAHKPGVYVTIEGVAASAATIAACAATRCTIGFGSLFMIHEASGLTLGPADSHRDMAQQLDIMNDTMAASYAARTKRPASEMRAMMKSETWMSAETAVAYGFCDAIVGAPSDHPAFARFDYGKYKHAPASILSQARRVGMAKVSAQVEQERAAQIADACLEAGLPEMTSELIKAPISVAEARNRAAKVRSSREARAMSRASMEKIIRQRGEEPVKLRR